MNKETPPRPKVTKAMIREAAVKILAANGIAENADDIAEAYHHGMDAYALAKDLDNYHGWDIDANIVEALGGMFSEVHTIHKTACHEWVAQHNIMPPLPNGTEIKEGVITSVCQYSPACYLVKERGCTNDKRSMVVKFEDAAPINQELKEVK